MFFLQLLRILPERSYEDLSGKSIELTGTVIDIEEKQTAYLAKQTILSVQDVTFCSVPFSNEKTTEYEDRKKQARGVLCYMSPAEDLPQMGDRVRIFGEILPFKTSRNPGEFDLSSYQQKSGFEFAVKDGEILESVPAGQGWRASLFHMRKNFADIYEAIADADDAGIMNAMILGERTQLRDEIRELYQGGGISHILAISGLHISFLGLGLYHLLRKTPLPIPVCGGIAGALIWGYVLMTGSSPSAIRALLMLLLKILAEVSGYAYEPVTALAVSCGIQALGNPALLMQSGFQLSYGGILGLLLAYPALRELSDHRIWRMFAPGLAIHLVTMPILVKSYYGITIYSFLLNLIVIPMMGLVLMGGLGALMVGSLSGEAGRIFFVPVHWILLLFEKGCRGSMCLPGNFWVMGEPKWWQILLYYVLFLLWLTRRRTGNPMFFLLCLLGMLSVLQVRSPGAPLTLTVLDVGQGDSCVGELADGVTFMIDCGSTSNEKLTRYTVSPFLKSRKITDLDYVFLSHMDQDHISGVEELLSPERNSPVRIKRVILPALRDTDEDFLRIVRKTRAAGAKVYRMGMGDQITLGDAKIRCLYPERDGEYRDRNDGSMALELSFGSFKALFLGDLDGEGEQAFRETMEQYEFKEKNEKNEKREKNEKNEKDEKDEKNKKEGFDEIAGLKQVTLLKAGHHGSKASTSKELLSMVHPAITVISCGEKNRYGHPAQDTVRRIRESGSLLYVTKEAGAIRIETNGKWCRASGFWQQDSPSDLPPREMGAEENFP